MFYLHVKTPVKESDTNDYNHKQLNNVGNACGFRPNWLSFQVFFTIADKTGKKACIINHR